MGRSRELQQQARRLARRCLDRASTSLDRLGSLVRDWLARRTRDNSAPVESAEPIPPARPIVTRADEPGGAVPEPTSGAAVTDLAALTKTELYRLAQQQDIAGRSRLSKQQLVEALESSAGD